MSTPTVPGVPPTGPKPSAAEGIKIESRYLRGALTEELQNELPTFSKAGIGLLKFHGIYQQDDRDVRKSNSGKIFTSMVRVSVPGGATTARQYLALDALADSVGDGTLRITTRGGIQYHHIGKRDLHALVNAIGKADMTTLAACGDVVRNVVADPFPVAGPNRADLYHYINWMNREMKPRTDAYAEIWLDGEKVASLQPAPVESEEVEPLYGQTYLPRKFKIAFTYEGENTVDIYSHDLGFVSHFEGGTLAGFTLLAGGGLGMTNGQKATYPRLADEVAFIEPEDLVKAASAVVTIHRDFGDRSNRKHARLKYVIAERGLEWFKQELDARMGKTLAPPRELVWHRQSDYLGWHAQDGGGWFYGLRVINGRIQGPQREAAREMVREMGCEVRFTPQQNMLFVGLNEEQRVRVQAILLRHGLVAELPPVLRHALACPALPTCGLALAEAERTMPEMVGRIQEKLDAAGLKDESIYLRMTGCPNGCARPYTAEIGVVGMSVNLYTLYLGGSPVATRLGEAFRSNVPGEKIAEALEPVIVAYGQERQAGETFGDYCYRAGVESLKERFAGEVLA